MRTTWRTPDPLQTLTMLQERLAVAEEVTAVERDGGRLVVRSRDVPIWAHLASILLAPILTSRGPKSPFLKARTERVLRITAVDHTLVLEGDANAGVSKVLVMTHHELFPPETSDSGANRTD